MTNVLTFTTPLMRRTVGFDRFNDLFESIFDDKPTSYDNYPPHNIEKLGENRYRITMAVAGFKMKDLNIVLNEDMLTVSGAHHIPEHSAKDKEEIEVLHHGIANRAFERSFRLADHIKVVDAALKDGLLTISLEQEIPEEKKPRLIKIKG